mgnify:CR=1 FL=1
MKKILLLTLSLVSLLSVSCKDDKKAGEDNAANAAPVKPNFFVEVDANAAKKDDFAVYFTEDGTNNFNGQNTVWHGINAGKTETVVFDLPEPVIPTNIRLDFGLNKEQDSVTVSRVKFSFLNNNLEIKGSQFFDYFIKDEQFKATTDPAKGTLTIVKNGPEYKTPYYYPRQELIDKIKEMTIGKK